MQQELHAADTNTGLAQHVKNLPKVESRMDLDTQNASEAPK